MAEQYAQRDASAHNTWWSRAILIGAVVAVALLPIGALGTRFGLWDFPVGLLLLAAGTVLAAIGLVCGVAGIIAAHRRRLSADKPAVYLGTVMCLLILAVMAMQFAQATRVPPIHNISTDVDDPPEFDVARELRGEGTNPLEYDAEVVGPQQRLAYPDVRPLQTALPPEQAVERSVSVLRDMGMDIVNVDPPAGLVEAVATTFWFGFKDDVVVRVRPAESGSVVDVRSVSRVGVSDLGTNAQRIQRFLEAFER
jgi:uncharacterized protein (DUF1499 family)